MTLADPDDAAAPASLPDVPEVGDVEEGVLGEALEGEEGSRRQWKGLCSRLSVKRRGSVSRSPRRQKMV